jgi:hypothetical protein
MGMYFGNEIYAVQVKFTFCYVPRSEIIDHDVTLEEATTYLKNKYPNADVRDVVLYRKLVDCTCTLDIPNGPPSTSKMWITYDDYDYNDD